MNFLLVAFGSAIGGMARYAISLAMNRHACGFPWGTFSVNVAGSLVIGLVIGLVAHPIGHAAAWRAFAVVGVCGGFTTFSTFSNESLRMLESGQWGMFALYVFGSVAAGIVAVALGYALAR